MGFHRSVSPSPTTRSSISTDDENEENYNPVMRGNTTPRHKRSAKKNYMSSTFSAASKVVTPKKKTILAERNNASDASSSSSSDPELEPENKNPVLAGLRSPMPTKANDDDKDEKPYDPQTNFLSPRPQFLRYNPERRREIFRDSVSSDSNSSDSNSSSSLIAGEIGGLRLSDGEETKPAREEANNEGQEINEEATEEEETLEASDESEDVEEAIRETCDESEEAEEEEEEEEYERRGGIMATVILMLILGLSAMFVVSVNKSRPLPSPPVMFGEDVFNEFGQRIVLNNSVEDLLLKRIKARSTFLLNMLAIEKEKIDQANEVEEKAFQELGQMKIYVDMEDGMKITEQEIEEVADQGVEDCNLQEEEEQVLEASFESPLSESSFVSPLSKPVEEEEVTDKSHGVSKVGYLMESLKRIEAEFAVKLFMGLVSFLSVIVYLSSQAWKKKPSEKKIIRDKQEELDHHNQVYSYTDNLSYTQSHAPSVEFLSEFEVSSQNRSSEDSPLYRSFSAREDFGDGEAQTRVTPASKRSSRKNSVMTPVRRSDRIRGRTIMSPGI